MVVTERENEFADLKIADVRDHLREQRVRADVERHAEERVRRSLIKLAVKQRCSSPTVRKGVHVLNLELKHRMARRQIDVVAFTRIPAADDQTTRVRIRLNLVD